MIDERMRSESPPRALPFDIHDERWMHHIDGGILELGFKNKGLTPSPSCLHNWASYTSTRNCNLTSRRCLHETGLGTGTFSGKGACPQIQGMSSIDTRL